MDKRGRQSSHASLPVQCLILHGCSWGLGLSPPTTISRAWDCADWPGPGHGPLPKPVSPCEWGGRRRKGCWVLTVHAHSSRQDWTHRGVHNPGQGREGFPKILRRKWSMPAEAKLACYSVRAISRPLCLPLLPIGESGTCLPLPRTRCSDQRTRLGCEGEASAPSQAGEPRTGPQGRTRAPRFLQGWSRTRGCGTTEQRGLEALMPSPRFRVLGAVCTMRMVSKR